jgi:arylsulfatase A-like enzyme
MVKKSVVCGAAAALLVLAPSCRRSGPNRVEFARGDVIRLIQTLRAEDILRTPLRMDLRTITGERLGKAWKKTASLPDDLTIWQTQSKEFIVTGRDSGSDPATRLSVAGRVFKRRADLFRPGTPAGTWSCRDDRVMICVAKKEDPNKADCRLDYLTFEEPDAGRAKDEKLGNPVSFGSEARDDSASRLVAFPLRFPLWIDAGSKAPYGITVRRNGRKLPFEPGLPDRAGLPLLKGKRLFPPGRSGSAAPALLARTSDSLACPLPPRPGDYVVRVVARASLAGPEPPLAVAKVEQRVVGRQAITKETWRTYDFRVSTKQGERRFSLEFANDYLDPRTGADRNISIARVDLCRDASTEGRPKAGPGRTVPGGAVRTGARAGLSTGKGPGQTVPGGSVQAGARAGLSTGRGPSPAWSWLCASEPILDEVMPFDVFTMLTRNDSYKVKRFFRPGLVSVRVTAKGELAGDELPRLGLYLDGRAADTVLIRDETFHDYRLTNIPVPGGWHELRLVFENDFYNVRSLDDRNIILSRVTVEYDSALIVSEPQAEPPGEYTVDYPTKAPYRERLHYYRRFLSGKPAGHDPVVHFVDLSKDYRRALVCPPPTEITFGVLVPDKGRLTFSWGLGPPGLDSADDRGTSEDPGLRVNVRARSGRRETVFSTDTRPGRTESPPWEEETVDLSAWAGREVELTFETRTLGRGPGDLPCVYVANPTVLSGAPLPAGRPNIILVSADALRADHLACYGYERATSPNIDRFGRESLLFENVVSPAPWTLPSFSSVFTSVYPSLHGANLNTTRLLETEITLPEILRSQGYTTAAYVNNIFLFPSHGLCQGYDFYTLGNYDKEEELREVVRRLDVLKDQPFFFFIHFLSPHSPYQAPRPFCEAFGDPDHARLDTSNKTLTGLDNARQILSAADRAYVVAQYDGAILYLDDLLGRLWAALKEAGLYDESLVIFISDHGEQFQEHGRLLHGHSVFRQEIRVPLMIKLPATGTPEPRRISDLVGLIDLAPTILDLIGAPAPESFQGQSLRPLLDGSSGPDRVAFSELDRRGLLAVRRGRFKYVTLDPELIQWPEGHPEGRRRFRSVREDLYDLESDPGELHDLSARRPDLMDMFREQKSAFLRMVALLRETRPGAGQSRSVVLDAIQREQMRALGYIH